MLLYPTNNIQANLESLNSVQVYVFFRSPVYPYGKKLEIVPMSAF